MIVFEYDVNCRFWSECLLIVGLHLDYEQVRVRSRVKISLSETL